MSNPCRCCPPANEAATNIDNPPGLDAIGFRIDTQGGFKRAMLEALAAQPALARLSTRADDDRGIALLDAWACVLDVLSFYQERIANEGFLRTATERRSVLELARALGYELRPGVAATTDLAFTMETAPGAPPSALVAAGTKVQSIPVQGQQPQIFETLEKIEAHGAWNALRVLSTQALLPLTDGRKFLYFQGQSLQLQPGDALLLVADAQHWDFRRVRATRAVAPPELTPDGSGGYTVVELDRGLANTAGTCPRAYVLRKRTNLFGYNAPDWRTMPQGVRAAYLGLDASNLNGSQATLVATYPEWPGFSLAELSDPPPGPSAQLGFLADYYQGTSFNTLLFSRVEPQVDFSSLDDARPWGPKVPSTNFSVRWNGWIHPTASGTHEFRTLSDDGVRLWVDDTLLIDNWTLHPPTQNTASIELVKERQYSVRLEYFQQGGAAAMQLQWRPPGVDGFEIIPASQVDARNTHKIKLDAVYAKITAGSWVVLENSEHTDLYRVEAAGETALANFALSAKVTWLELSGDHLYPHYNQRLRETGVFGETEELFWTEPPLGKPVQGDWLVLTTLEPDLRPGRRLAVTGLCPAPDADPDLVQRLVQGEELTMLTLAKDNGSALLRFAGDSDDLVLPLTRAAERVDVLWAIHDGPTSVLKLVQPLQNAYLPRTLRTNANVASASHGDSRQMRIQPEVLGSGEGSAVFQSFLLKQAPLTYLSSATPSGAASTLQVQVDGIVWDELPSFFGVDPATRGYVVRRADEGAVTVRFGDGLTGARLPSGVENVRAVYRVGIGTSGNLDTGQLSLLLTQQLGLKSVTNPQAATGGTDPEKLEQARRNAPLTVLTLDRIVSLSDFADFAATFAGIGKASATWLWDGKQRVVHVSVAAADGAALPDDSPLLVKLATAMDAARPPHQSAVIAVGTLLRLPVSAWLHVLKGYDFAVVSRAVKTALSEAFGFLARDFAQPMSGSELVAVMQAVEGVDYVVLETFGDGALASDLSGDPIAARSARWENGTLQPVELLLVDPDRIQLLEINA